MSIFPTCVFVYSAYEGQKKALDPLGLELKMVLR